MILGAFWVNETLCRYFTVDDICDQKFLNDLLTLKTDPLVLDITNSAFIFRLCLFRQRPFSGAALPEAGGVAVPLSVSAAATEPDPAAY